MDRDNDSERLRKLYAERVPEGMSQEQFGKAFGIGNQSMVSQYLSGHRPLNYDAVGKFARGLRCTISDISPELARRLRVELVPLLGRVSLKAALALVFVGFALIPPKVEAAFGFNINKVHIAFRRWLSYLKIAHNS